jgi:hypothetical protein
MPLDRLLGIWDVAMDHHAVDGIAAGQHVYERVLDGAFVGARWALDNPAFPDAQALMTDEVMHYFDVRGVIRVFEVTWTEDGWTLVLLSPEFSQRMVSAFVGPDEVRTEGFLSEDLGETWNYDFVMELSRRASPR